jgi:hypothetical protein
MSLIKNKKFKTIVILAVLGIVSSGFFSQAYAQPRMIPDGGGSKETCQGLILVNTTTTPIMSSGFELTYPDIKGVVPIATGKDVLPVFVKYLFYLAIGMAGFIAFGALVYGGLKYLTSAGNPSATDEARKQIIAGFLGVIVLLSSAWFLNTINPKLTILSLKKVDVKTIENQIGIAAGVYLISAKNDTEQIKAGDTTLTIRKNVGTTKSIPSLSAYNFDNKTQNLCFAPDYNNSLFFSAVLHEEDNFRGKCRVFHRVNGSMGTFGNLNWAGTTGDDINNEVSSVTVFTRSWGTGGENYSKDFAVRLYKKSQLVGDPAKPDEVCTLSASELLNATPIKDVCKNWTPESVGSLEVGYGWVLAAFQYGDGTGRCEIFGSGKVPEIKKHYIGQCYVFTPQAEYSYEGYWKPCIGSIAIFQGNIQ